jgi:hypothetical protein
MSAFPARPRAAGAAPFVTDFTWRGLVGRWRERYAAVCQPCFEARLVCGHYPELPLRTLELGHNPSEHAFESGFFYSNPTNRMWALLTGAAFGKAATDGAAGPLYEGVVPHGWPLAAQNATPLHVGLGYTDLGVEPGNDAAAYPVRVLHAWRDDLFEALRGHLRRVAATLGLLHDLAHDGGDAAPDATAGNPASSAPPWLSRLTPSFARQLLADVQARTGVTLLGAPRAVCATPEACAPRVVAVTGKNQFKCLFDPPLATAELGWQPRALRPPGWPLPPCTEVSRVRGQK